uniref:Zinc finger protein 654 n=1 Tax=Oncorhynchus mykiss TaxID=8022 RepID=A0A8C7PKL8_ONCMY
PVHTGRWQVPLPQLKVLRTALTCFTRATVAYPDDCQHVNYALSSLALSFFELMLFFGKEEFLEAPLRDILASFQACHRRLLRHRNVYLLQVRQIIKDGGPWERPALQSILKDTALTQTEVEKYLSSEKPMFFELRVRYLQACERVQEAMALAKCCLEHPEVWRHLFFHQAYLTCLYKASLHQHLDAVEIICNAESQEKDELLLSLCKAFLSQRLHNGDMYYIWDLVFLWSRLYLRAHPSKQGFLSECRQLMLSAINASAIFPFIKVITAEVGVHEGVPLCVELCATALQTDLQSDPVTRCLLCKTIAFLLPRDLEVCRLCALLAFCLERSMEAYKTMYLLYTYPDEEPHPQHTHVRTNIRFYILQVLKEGLFFDPEFWNLLTLRTHCLELMTDKAMRDALNELKEEEELDLFLHLQGEQTKPGKAPVRSKHLRFHCSHCQKLFKGGNVVRHTLAHLKLRKTRLSCVFCGKHFQRYNRAREHVLEHIEELRTSTANIKVKPTVNGETYPSKNINQASENEAKPVENVTEPSTSTDQEVVPGKETEGGEDKESEGGEEEGKQKQYHLCPSEGCDSIFMKIGPSLLRHAVTYHMEDAAVLDKTFQWGKGKCQICQRLQLDQNVSRDHMKLHDAPLKHACLHTNCDQRFKTAQELKDHIDTHRPLQAPCGYSGCREIFFTLPSLHDHEWRHYTQPQSKDELEQGATTELSPEGEAPWKQRAKSQDVTTPGTVHGAVTTPPNHCTLKLINGHDEKDKKDKGPETAVPATTTTSPTPPSQTTTSTHPHPRILQNITEPMTMRDVDNIVSLAQVVPGGEEPVIAEHKTLKQEDPSYLPLAKAPLIRPPPSTYLTEAALSMRKRRKPSEVTSCGPGKKSKAAVKRSVVGKKEVVAEKEAPQRQRCSKCFSSFTSTEELEKHLSQNTCSSLFSFDSDDDSE